MKSYTEDGVLVLADISGFTAFVAATELEHGPPIIAELLGEVMGRLAPPLEIQEVEGDAVFALGADRLLGSPAAVLGALEDAAAAFRNRQRELQADESCSCQACRRSEEHTSELQSLGYISYAVFCLNKKRVLPAEIGRASCRERVFGYV